MSTTPVSQFSTSTTEVRDVAPDAASAPTAGSKRAKTRARFVPTAEADGRLLARLGGIALAAAPVVMVVGFYTSPPQDSSSHVDYVASMARAPFQAALSASLLHYCWVLWILAVFSLLILLRGRRGRLAGSIAVVAAAIASIQISGLLLSDFYAIRMTQLVGADQAAQIEFGLGRAAGIWLTTGQFAALLVPVMFGFLAYSRVISWWLAPLPFLGALSFLSPLPAPVNAALMIITWAPAFVAAFQLISGRRRVISPA